MDTLDVSWSQLLAAGVCSRLLVSLPQIDANKSLSAVFCTGLPLLLQAQLANTRSIADADLRRANVAHA